MDLTIIGLKIFVVSFLLNFLWEVQHSQLYTTCHRMKLIPLVRLLTWQTTKDAFWIVSFFLVVVLLFGLQGFMTSAVQMLSFVFLLLMFAWTVEKHALRTGRWNYSSAMPTVLGVGLSPLLELAVTGTLTLVLVFLFIPIT